MALGGQAVLFAFSLAVFVYHLRTLPFHDKFINQVRADPDPALLAASRRVM